MLSVRLYCSPLSSSSLPVSYLDTCFITHDDRFCLKEEISPPVVTCLCQLIILFMDLSQCLCEREVNIMSVHSREMISCPPEYFFLWTILHKMCYTLFLFVLISIYSSLHNFYFLHFLDVFCLMTSAGRQATIFIKYGIIFTRFKLFSITLFRCMFLHWKLKSDKVSVWQF